MNHHSNLKPFVIDPGFVGRFVTSCLIFGSTLGFAIGVASASLVNYTNNDAINTSSFTGGTGATNWDNGQPPAAGNDYFVAFGKSLRTPTNGLPSAKYTFAGNSLTLAGQLSMKGSNTIIFPSLVLSNNTSGLINGDPGVIPKIVRVGGNVLIKTNAWVNSSDTNRTIIWTATISGSNNLSVVGLGSFNLSGSHPFAGPLTLTGHYVDMDGTTVLTPSALVVGKDATVAGVTNAGLGTFTTNVYFTTNIVRAGGNLNVGTGPAGDLRVAWRTLSNTNNNVVATLDVSAQSQFNANVGNFLVGYSGAASSGTRASAAGFVFLATNNTILATNVMIGDTIEAVSTLTSQVVFGRGSNRIDSPIMVVGGRKQSATLTLPAGGTLILTNSANGRTDLTVGANQAGTAGVPADLMDLSGGPLIASLGNLILGQKTGGLSGGAVATLTLATNTANLVDVNSVTLGSMAGNVSGSTAAAGTLNLNGGAFKVNNDLTLASYDFSGSGTAIGTLNLNAGNFTVAGNVANAGGTSTLNLNSGTMSVGGDITSAGISTVNVSGGFLDLLPAGDSVKGNLTVSNLVLNGTITNANNISVTSLSGSGASLSQAGVLTVAGSLNPGTALSAGTLTVGSLVLDSGTIWRVNLAGNPTPGGGVNDLLVVNGDLSFPNASLIIAQASSTLDTTTPYVLATYTGQLTGLPTYPSTIGRYSLALVADETKVPKRLTLVVTGNPYLLLWGGELGSAWDVNTTQNWTNRLDNSPQFYFDSDQVQFDDTSANPNVSLDVPVQPGGVTVNNNLSSYTFSGSGMIAGPGGLAKNGTAQLTLNTSNTFLGPVAINAGLLTIGNGGALGATNGATTIAANATLDVNLQNLGSELIHVQGVGYDGNGAIVNNGGADARNATRYVVLDGPTTFGTPYRWDIRGTGAAGSAFLHGGSYPLTKTGINTLALTAGCDVSVGDILVSAGNVAFEAASTMNAGFGITVNSTATLSFYQLATPLGRNVVLQDGATLSGNSSSAANQNQLNGSLTLNGVGNITTGAGASNILAGPVTGPGSFVKLGVGSTILTGTANNWAGGTTISAGTLQIGSGGADGSLSDRPLTNNATLIYNSSLPLRLTAPVAGPGTWQMQNTGLVTLAGQLTGAGRFNVYSNGNLTVSGTIDTTSGITKYGYGTLTLVSSNSFPGTVVTGSGGPTTQGTAGGIIRLLNAYGFGDPSISKTVQVVRAELHLEGGVTVATNIYFQTSTWSGSTGEGAGYLAIRNVAGTNTIPNPVEIIGGSGSSEYRSDAGLLVFNGPIFLGNTSTRSAIFSGAADGVVNGVISSQTTNVLAVSKSGTGTWIFTAANAYNGPTAVSGGTLLVNGSIGGSGVTVQANSTLGGMGTISPATTFSSGSHAVFTLGSPLTFGDALVLATSGGIPDVHLNLSNNVPVGTYPLATFNPAGSSGAFNPNPVVDKGSLVAGTQGAITTSGGIVSLVVTTSAPATPSSFPAGAVSILPDGNLSLVATGAVGAQYRLWATTNLALAPVTNTWLPLATNTISASGATTNFDLKATNYPHRFYLFSTP